MKDDDAIMAVLAGLVVAAVLIVLTTALPPRGDTCAVEAVRWED